MVLEPDGTELAYNAIKAIAQLNDKFYHEFCDTDADCVKDNTNDGYIPNIRSRKNIREKCLSSAMFSKLAKYLT